MTIGLFLDLSTRIGWALFQSAADPSPVFGTYRLPRVDRDDIAGRTLPLRIWLRTMLFKHMPDVVGFESPLVMSPSLGGGSFTMASTIRLQIALAGEVETTARECKISRVMEAANQSAKKAMTGAMRLGEEWQGKPAEERSKEWKRRMVGAAMARGWAVADEHQADAGAVGLVCYGMLS